jgi:hypothetical protein
MDFVKSNSSPTVHATTGHGAYSLKVASQYTNHIHEIFTRKNRKYCWLCVYIIIELALHDGKIMVRNVYRQKHGKHIFGYRDESRKIIITSLYKKKSNMISECCESILFVYICYVLLTNNMYWNVLSLRHQSWNLFWLKFVKFKQDHE